MVAYYKAKGCGPEVVAEGMVRAAAGGVVRGGDP
jgi:hypothetical protein